MLVHPIFTESTVTQEQLQHLLNEVVDERSWLEFKGRYNKDVARSIRETVAALANAAGGIILVGVEDPKNTEDRRPKIVGVPITTLETLGTLFKDGLAPPYFPEVFPVPLSSGEVVVVIRVIAGDARRPIMLTNDGRFLVRTSKGNAPADYLRVRSLFQEESINVPNSAIASNPFGGNPAALDGDDTHGLGIRSSLFLPDRDNRRRPVRPSVVIDLIDRLNDNACDVVQWLHRYAGGPIGLSPWERIAPVHSGESRIRTSLLIKLNGGILHRRAQVDLALLPVPTLQGVLSQSALCGQRLTLDLLVWPNADPHGTVLSLEDALVALSSMISTMVNLVAPAIAVGVLNVTSPLWLDATFEAAFHAPPVAMNASSLLKRLGLTSDSAPTAPPAEFHESLPIEENWAEHNERLEHLQEFAIGLLASQGYATDESAVLQRIRWNHMELWPAAEV